MFWKPELMIWKPRKASSINSTNTFQDLQYTRQSVWRNRDTYIYKIIPAFKEISAGGKIFKYIAIIQWDVMSVWDRYKLNALRMPSSFNYFVLLKWKILSSKWQKYKETKFVHIFFCLFCKFAKENKHFKFKIIN